MIYNLDELARRQLIDYKHVNPGTCFGEENFALTIEEAYAVQDAVVSLRLEAGEKVSGYKVGCTGPGTTKLFGMQGPIRGTLFDTEIHESGVKLNSNHFLNLAIEAEMAIEVGENGNIVSVFPIIELHNFIFRAPKKSLSELIANNGLNRGIVLSNKTWRTLPETYDKTSLLSLEINGSVIDSGELWPMEGGPKSSLNWLENHLGNHGLKTTESNIILGGTALGLHRVQPGDYIEVKVDKKIAVQCVINPRSEA
ncbi:hypothetical protein N9V53_07835 [Amylibacter sp.]|nr:hypothetical protein [Amylibacter sp.]